MLKKTYCYEYQSYFCHYGARPSVSEYDTLEEAKHWQAVNMRVNDDAIIGPIFVKKTVVLTDEDIKKQEQRKALKKTKFVPQWNAVITYWDGSKEVVYMDGDKVFFKNKTYVDDIWLYLSEGETISLWNRERKQKVFTIEGGGDPFLDLVKACYEAGYKKRFH